MMILAGQSNPLWHYAAGRWPGKVGLLLGPAYFTKQAIRPWLPYVLDNDAFSAWTNGTEWNHAAWTAMLQRAMLHKHKPSWVLVPDVVTDKAATLANWEKHAPEAATYRWPLAFAAQDGMTPDDVPSDAAIVFIGGSTEWKWRSLPTWCANFRRVHVGRVNNIEKVYHCEDMGVESVDGTGWFKDPTRDDKLPALLSWFEGERRNEHQLVLHEAPNEQISHAAPKKD